jgi:RNA polymerase sigma factor (sigma-70 family)
VDTQAERDVLVAARRGEQAAFERLVFAYRRELFAHCYRMLGSIQDAEDALQESLLGAWRGLRAFEGRCSVRTWLYQIASNACLRLISRRPRRILSPDYGRRSEEGPGDPVTGPIWLEPWPEDGGVVAPGDVDPAARVTRCLHDSIERHLLDQPNAPRKSRSSPSR